MSGRAKRVLLTTVVVAALLLLVQVLTYMFLAEAAMP
jgi:hypothetical protein